MRVLISAVADVVSLKERGKYQGITGCVIAASNSIGPILGGVFTQDATWRWCFWINLPLTAISIIIIVFILPLRRVKGDILSKLRKLDFYGSLLTLMWAVGILLALSWAGTQYAWSSAAVLVPLILGLALLVVFLYVEAKVVPLPLIPLGIFKNQTVSSAMTSTFFSGMAFYATLYYLPVYYQVVRGDTAIRSGVLTLPLILVQTVFAFSSGILVSKTGDYWWNLNIGFFLWTIGLGLMGYATSLDDPSEGMLAGFQVIVGVGAGQTFQTSLIAIQAAVARRDMAAATGTRNAMRMLGGTLSLAACSAILNNIVRTQTSSMGVSGDTISAILADPTMISELGLSQAEQAAVLAAYGRGISACFYFMCPLAGISLILTLFFIQKIPLKREDDAAKKAEAKAWVESKRLKRKAAHEHKHGHEEEHGQDETRMITEKSRPGSGSDLPSSAKESLEGDLEKAGRGLEEAAGVSPSKGEGEEQGVVG